MNCEYFEILDCRGRKTGQVISRDEAHRSGTWHGAFHCLIIYEREGRGYALFQKRSSSKKIAPGRFDVSVGGHYSAGENARSAGPREIREELGLEVKFEELLPLGRRVFVYCFTPGVTEYEFQDVFLLHKQIKPGEIRFQKEEVEALLEMKVEEGVRLFSGDVSGVQCAVYKSNQIEQQMITAEEFVPCLDNYYLKLLLLAKKFFGGERKLLFV